jgi:peroxiredoxin
MSEKRKAVVGRLNALAQGGTPGETLACLDELIAIDGEVANLLEYRCHLLSQLGRHEEALHVAERIEEVAERKTPWNLLRVAEALIALGRMKEAYPWIERAVRERRFRRVKAFGGAAYDAVRDDCRFGSLVREASANIGLGREAEDFSLRLLDGRQIALSDYRGSVVLLDFWSVDCPPCVREIPILRELHQELGQDGFIILGVNLDEDIDRVTAFVDEHDMTWPMACSGKGRADATSLLYDVQARPSMWLIDKRGIVRYFDVRGQELGEAVRLLLAEP